MQNLRKSATRPLIPCCSRLKAAGVDKADAADVLTEGDKQRLLSHLQVSHGSGAKKITLTKKSTSEIKQADSSGRARTIQVEVRKKRTS